MVPCGRHVLILWHETDLIGSGPSSGPFIHTVVSQHRNDLSACLPSPYVVSSLKVGSMSVCLCFPGALHRAAHKSAH